MVRIPSSALRAPAHFCLLAAAGEFTDIYPSFRCVGILKYPAGQFFTSTAFPSALYKEYFYYLSLVNRHTHTGQITLRIGYGTGSNTHTVGYDFWV